MNIKHRQLSSIYYHFRSRTSPNHVRALKYKLLCAKKVSSISSEIFRSTRHSMDQNLSISRMPVTSLAKNSTDRLRYKSDLQQTSRDGHETIRNVNKNEEYQRAMRDLNSLQSNSQVVALAKYKNPGEILPLFARQLDLAGISVEKLNNLNIIHISGTKGKGSTCAFIERILRGNGLKTGFYNSPHLIKVTERIRINGEPLSEDQFCHHFRHVFDKMVDKTRENFYTMPSYFSFLTILAFHIFLEEKVDCAIIEVGIGGQFDPTNIIERPIVCGITTLDYDHCNILGSTMESIAKSKAGIAKPEVPLFTLEHQNGTAQRIIEECSAKKNSPLYVCKSMSSENLPTLGISGRAQYSNASLACHIADYFLRKVSSAKKTGEKPEQDLLQKYQTKELVNITDFPSSFRDALESCSWLGRCQIVETKKGIKFFIDGAHTKKSMQNCVEWFTSVTKATRSEESVFRILMVNVIGERDKFEVLYPLERFDHFDLVIFSTNRVNSAGDTAKSETFMNLKGPNNEKSIDNAKVNAEVWESLVKRSGGKLSEIAIMANTYDSIEMISSLSKQHPDKKFHVLTTGSLHFVGAVLETLPLLDE